MKVSDRWLNVEYAFVQGFYWMGFCVCMSFAAVFLQGRGYSNSSLGLIIALGNVLGFVLAPSLASVVDRGRGVTVFRCVWVLLALQLLLLLCFTRIRAVSLGFSALYCLYIAFNAVVNTMNTQMSFDLGGWSGRINYSAARGCGSLAYAPTALLIGGFVQRHGSDVLPYIGILFLLLQAVMLALVSAQSKRGADLRREAAADKGDALSLVAFIRGNRRFCLLLGMGFIFFSHNLVTNFLINVVRNVGGDTTTMGGLNGFSALMEIPVMLLYALVARRFRCASLLRFSVVAFVAKSICTALASSVGWLFAAHLLQGLSFALLTPASVQYTSLVVGPKDSTKGQALSYGMSTLGSAFAGGFGGMLYDSIPVRGVLLIGAAVSAMGAVICEMGIDSRKSL